MRTKQYKYVFYDENGKIVRLLKSTEKAYMLNANNNNNRVLRVSRNTNVPLNGTVVNGEIV